MWGCLALVIHNFVKDLTQDFSELFTAMQTLEPWYIFNLKLFLILCNHFLILSLGNCLLHLSFSGHGFSLESLELPFGIEHLKALCPNSVESGVHTPKKSHTRTKPMSISS